MAGENKVRPKTFKEWLENFWYYYKYHTIIILALLMALSVSVVQCSSKVDYDYNIILSSATVEFAPSQIENLNNELIKYGKDLNGDGKVSIGLVDCTFNQYKSSYQVITAKKQKLQSVLMNEQETVLLITDKECFEWLSTVFEREFLEDLNLSKEDGRIFPLEDTPLLNAAKKDGGLNPWPKDLSISRRVIKGTLFEGKEKSEMAVKAADEYLKILVSQNS